MSYVIDYIERFEQYMQDIELFYAIFELMPQSYKYQVVMNLIEVEPLLQEGDIRKGIKRRGCILVQDYCITCIDKDSRQHVLCALPQPFDI